MVTQSQVDEINKVFRGEKSADEAKAAVDSTYRSRRRRNSRRREPTTETLSVDAQGNRTEIYTDSSGNRTILYKDRFNRIVSQEKDTGYTIERDSVPFSEKVAADKAIIEGKATARDILGRGSVDLTPSNVKALRERAQVAEETKQARESRGDASSPMFYGYEPVASTRNKGYIYQSTTSKEQYSASPVEIGSGLTSFTLERLKNPDKRINVPRIMTAPSAKEAYYSKLLTKSYLVANTSQAKTAYNVSMEVRGNVKGAGLFTYDIVKGLPSLAMSSYENVNRNFDNFNVALGVYGKPQVEVGEAAYRPATAAERISIGLSSLGRAEVQTAGTILLTNPAVIGMTSIKAGFGVVGVGVAGYEGFKTVINPSAEQRGRLYAASVLGVFGAADIYAGVLKPTAIRYLQKEVPDTYLSKIAKETGKFDNPKGSPAQRFADVQQRVLDATTKARTTRYIKTTKLYSDNLDLASGTFLIDMPKTYKRKSYVELTTSAQSGVKSNSIESVNKAAAGLEEAIINFSAKKRGEPAFLRLGDGSINSEGYSLFAPLGDYFRTPTLFNLRVSGVQLLPKWVRYASREGIAKANKFYESVANKGPIKGYYTLRSSLSLGKAIPTKIKTIQDMTFKSGKFIKKGTVRWFTRTGEDEIAVGYKQEFRFLKGRGLKGWLNNKLFKSTNKRIELDVGMGESVPIPIQEGRVISRTKLSSGKYSKTNTKVEKIGTTARDLKKIRNSYMNQKSTVSRPSYFSRPSNVSRVSNVSKVSNISKTSNVSNVSRLSNISNVSQVSRVSRVSKVSNVSRVSGISGISRVSKISKISQVSSPSRPSKPISLRVKLPRFSLSRSSSGVKPSQYGRKFGYKTSLFAYLNNIKGKRNKFGETSGLGIRPM